MSLKDLYYNIKRGVQNLWFYIPLVWDNNSWDHGYCLKLYNDSLKRLHKQMIKDDFVMRDKHELRKLQACIGILDRQLKDEYEVPACEELDKKYDIQEEDRQLEFAPSDRPGFSIMVNTRERKLGTLVYKKYAKELSAIYKQSVIIKRNEFKLALKIIERNSNRWWS